MSASPRETVGRRSRMRIQGRCSNRALQGCGQEGGAPGFRGLLFPFLHRARRFFSFSKKRKKRMGAQKSGRPMVAPTFIDRNAIGFVGAGNARQTIPQSASLTAPFTQGSLRPLRRGRSMWSGLLLVGAFGGLGFMGGRVARVVQLLVAEVDEQVRADGQQIENIHGQHIGDVM